MIRDAGALSSFVYRANPNYLRNPKFCVGCFEFYLSKILRQHLKQGGKKKFAIFFCGTHFCEGPGVPWMLVMLSIPEGMLSYCTWAQDAASTKTQKENRLHPPPSQNKSIGHEIPRYRRGPLLYQSACGWPPLSPAPWAQAPELHLVLALLRVGPRGTPVVRGNVRTKTTSALGP